MWRGATVRHDNTIVWDRATNPFWRVSPPSAEPRVMIADLHIAMEQLQERIRQIEALRPISLYPNTLGYLEDIG